MQLIRIASRIPDLRVRGSSTAPPTARFAWWDNSRAHECGFLPADQARPTGTAGSEAAGRAQAKAAPDSQVRRFRFQGGTFCSAEFWTVRMTSRACGSRAGEIPAGRRRLRRPGASSAARPESFTQRVTI